MSCIATIVLTYNEEKRIAECLNSLSWCKEIWVVDSYSNDKTIDISKQYTENIVQHPFENFPIQRNWALDNLPIESAWVLFVDADEQVPDDLRDEILNRVGQEPGIVGYYIARKQYYWGKWIKHGGRWPDYRLILFKKGKGRYRDREVQEWAEVNGQTALIKSPLVSKQYDSAEKLLYVLNYCTTAEAIRMHRKGEALFSTSYQSYSRKNQFLKVLFEKIPLKPLMTFLWHYIFLQGFRDGRIGFILSLNQYLYVLYSYHKLWEIESDFVKPPEDLVWRKK